jgi:hypothetical protein
MSIHVLWQRDEFAIGRRDNGGDPAVDPDLAACLL